MSSAIIPEILGEPLEAVIRDARQFHYIHLQIAMWGCEKNDGELNQAAKVTEAVARNPANSDEIAALQAIVPPYDPEADAHLGSDAHLGCGLFCVTLEGILTLANPSSHPVRIRIEPHAPVSLSDPRWQALVASCIPSEVPWMSHATFLAEMSSKPVEGTLSSFTLQANGDKTDIRIRAYFSLDVPFRPPSSYYHLRESETALGPGEEEVFLKFAAATALSAYIDDGAIMAPLAIYVDGLRQERTVQIRVVDKTAAVLARYGVELSLIKDPAALIWRWLRLARSGAETIH